MLDKLSLGRLGERMAANYLSSHGYKIIEMNFQKRYGEIDIVAQDQDTLVFVEVKTRMENNLVPPEDSLISRKINSVKKSALFYKMKHPELPESLRIDFVGIVLDDALRPLKINHVENITM